MTFATSAFLTVSALVLGGLGALFAGQCGMLAFALEGVMLLGGLAGTLFSHGPLWLCLLIAGGVGAAYALLIFLPARFRGDGVFSGVALGGLATALAMLAARWLGGVSYSRRAFQLLVNGENVTVFLPLSLCALLLAWLLLYHTRLGAGLRLCGQDLEYARRQGVRARGMQCLSAVIFGFLGGLGGLAALIALGAGWQLKWGVGGMGLLCLAAAKTGKWKPLPLALAAALLGLFRAGAEELLRLGFGVPDGALRLAPFLLALLLLALQRGRDRAPLEAFRAENAHPARMR